MAEKVTNKRKEYQKTKNTLGLQLALSTAVGGYYYTITPMVFDDMKPEVPTFEDAKAAFLQTRHEECSDQMAEMEYGFHFCYTSEDSIQNNYETVVAQAEADLASFEQNWGSFEDHGPAAIALAFGIGAGYLIAKPTVQKLFRLKREIQADSHEPETV